MTTIRFISGRQIETEDLSADDIQRAIDNAAGVPVISITRGIVTDDGIEDVVERVAVRNIESFWEI